MRLLSWTAALPLLLFLLLPLLALLLRAPSAALWRNFTHPTVTQAILLSLQTSIAATALTVLLGTPLAYVLARRPLPFSRAVDVLIDLPIVLPPAVAGVALLLAFGRQGLLGPLLAPLGIQLVFTPLAVIIAQTFVASPFYLRAAVLGFAAVDPELEQAAALDGAGEWRLFTDVMLPMARTALLSGAVMTWARALGEFGATIIFAGNLPGLTQTMPLAIYLGFELDLDVALTLAVILLAFSSLVLFAVRVLLERERTLV